MSYTIIETNESDTFFLNHSCLSSLSFGSEDMAWTTEDEHKAELMLDKVENRFSGEDRNFEIIIY